MTGNGSPSAPRPTVEQMAADQLRHRVEHVAARLADLTERVKLYAGDIEQTGGPGRPNYANVARDVVHEINTTLMNLHLGSVVTAAAEADITRAKGE